MIAIGKTIVRLDLRQQKKWKDRFRTYVLPQLTTEFLQRKKYELHKIKNNINNQNEKTLKIES